MKYVLVLLFCSQVVWGQSKIGGQTGNVANKELQVQIKDSVFRAFADSCVRMQAWDYLMTTYRRSLDGEEIALMPEHLDFLYKAYGKKDILEPSENNYYICYYIARITIKFHLDNNTPAPFLQKAVDIAEKMHNDCLLLKADYTIASFYMNIKHDVVKANEYHMVMEAYMEKKKLNDVLDCNIDLNVGEAVVSYYLGDDTDAVNKTNKSIAITKKINRPAHLFDLYKRRAFFELDLQHYDAAMTTTDSALKIASTAADSINLGNFARAMQFNILVALKEYERATKLASQVDANALKKDNDDYFDYMANLVKLELHFNDYSHAKAHIDEYISELKPWNLQRWRKLHEMKYLYYKQLNKPDEALKAYEQYNLYNDSFHNQQQNFIVRQQKAEFERRENRRSLALEKAINKVRLQNTRLVASIIISVALCLLLVFGYKTYRTLKEKEKLTSGFSKKLIQNTDQERNRIATELHDGLGQELLLVKHALLHEDDANNAEKISEVIETVRGIARELYPAMLQATGLKIALENQLHKIDLAEDIFIATEIADINHLDKFAELQVFRIFQEALTNILKYAAASSVFVALSQDEQFTRLTIKDNGNGLLTPQKINSADSFGLISMKQRAESIGGELQISSVKGVGTEINLKIKR